MTQPQNPPALHSFHGWRRSALVFVVAASIPTTAGAEPKTELLWPNGAAGATGSEEKDKPKLILSLPEKSLATGAAVIICPGGGYTRLAMGHKGQEVAAWLNSIGVAAFICDYRHRGKGYGHPAPLHDAQRAIRTVRARATDFGVDPARIGILGFSAGGHLAATGATLFDNGNADASDPIERVSCRPDFAVLCYPVIALDAPYTHRGSQQSLLGNDADPKLIEQLSAEKQVTKQTPPTFLWHTNEDRGVPAENSIQFYLALRKANVPAELHIYEHGRHGLGLAKDIRAVSDWPRRCEEWLRGRGLLKKGEL